MKVKKQKIKPKIFFPTLSLSAQYDFEKYWNWRVDMDNFKWNAKWVSLNKENQPADRIKLSYDFLESNIK